MSNKRHKHEAPTVQLTMIRKSRKFATNRRVIADGETATKEYYLHSTKGYRKRKK